MKSNVQRRPQFFWQAVLILLPVAVLAALGLWALQQDRAATEQQVRTRAESLANAVLADLVGTLHPLKVTENRGGLDIVLASNVVAFAVTPNNELVWPEPLSWPPRPAPLPADLRGSLSSNKFEQWQGAEAAFAKSNWLDAAELYLAFLNGRRRLGTNVMADIKSGIGGKLSGGSVVQSLSYRSLALFRRGNAFEHLEQNDQAIEGYNDVFAAQPNGSEHSEAGLPWAHLAALKILDLAGDDFSRLPEDWRINPLPMVTKLSYDVSPFESELLHRLRGLMPRLSEADRTDTFLNSTFAGWERNVESRRSYAEAAESRAGDASTWPAAFWVQGQIAWLALAEGPFRNATNLLTAERFFVVFPESQLSNALAEFVAREDRAGEFAVRLELGGRTLAERDRPTANWRSRQNVFTAVSAEFPLAVTATLADPPAFFAGQRRRQQLFSALLLVAAATCAAACFSAHRAFQRQLQLNEAKSNFVSSVSHELRAPIASVRLLAESLERGKVVDDGKQREYFGFIVQECRRLSSLIENVLDFSRIEQGRKQYDFEPTDLVALTQITVKLMEPYAAERGVHLTHETPNAEGRVQNAEASVDGKAIQQALVNLIDNAIKHSPKEGTVTVGLDYRPSSDSGSVERCEREPTPIGRESRLLSPHPDPLPEEREQPAAISGRHDMLDLSPAQNPILPLPKGEGRGEGKGDSNPRTSLASQPSTICLFVEDHGDGIPPEDHERIFERFYRRGSELRRETQGVGIGLSIVKHIVEAHGGRVLVRSAIGEGSRFTIELPTTATEAQRHRENNPP